MRFGPQRRWNPEVVYNKMMEIDGDTINLAFDRSEQAQARQPNLFFSKEAMEALERQMVMWVGSRMMRKYNQTGKAPQSIEVQVRVTLDGESQPFTLPVEFSVIDGDIRARIIRDRD